MFSASSKPVSPARAGTPLSFFPLDGPGEIMLVRATKSLLKELDQRPSDLDGAESPRLMFHEWYGNLIYVKRRKCMVFCDTKTLFTFVMTGVVKKQYQDFQVHFLAGLQFALDSGGLHLPDDFACDSIKFGPTQDRRVLSSVNDLVRQFRFQVDRHRGLKHADMGSVLKRVNTTPMSLTDNSPGRHVAQELGLDWKALGWM